MIFQMNNMCGFETGKDYQIEIDETYCGYNVTGVFNYTDNIACDLFIRLSSKSSIDRYFNNTINNVVEKQKVKTEQSKQLSFLDLLKEMEI